MKIHLPLLDILRKCGDQIPFLDFFFTAKCDSAVTTASGRARSAYTPKGGQTNTSTVSLLVDI